MQRPAVLSLFEDLVSREDASIRLPAAALAIARVQYPDLAIAPYLAQLGEMGAHARERARGATSHEARLLRLNHYVFGELGFRGDRETYYDPRNSFLNDVLERRRGIPITLSLIYMELGAACNVAIDGVSFPGHFLVRDVATGWILDPFHGGARREVADCKEIYESQGYDPDTWSEELLAPVGKRHILLRMINNLRRHYAQVGDERRYDLLQGMARILREHEDTCDTPLQ